MLSTQNCGFSAGAAHHQGHLHLCREAEAYSHGFTVQQTIEIHQLLLYKVVDALVMQVVQVPGCHLPYHGAEASSRGPDFSADHRDLHLLVDKVVDAPVMQVVQVSRVSNILVVAQRQIPMIRLFSKS